MDVLSNQQIAAAGLDDWRKLAQALHATFRSPHRPAVRAFLTDLLVGEVDADPPDVRLSGEVVAVSVATRWQGGLWVGQSDLDRAARISALAAEHGLVADPAAVTQLELALDTADRDRIAPFWSALLTGSPDHIVVDSVVDPTGRVPSLWFQPTDEHEPPRQRWHLDLWLAPEVADARIAAAVAAGGSVVDDSAAPSFTVLADPDGNRVCICTSLDRS